MKKILLFILFPFILFGQSQIGLDIDGEAAGDRSGFSVSLSADGLTVAIGAKLNDGSGDSAGHVRVYEFSSGSWTQLGSDIDGEAADDKSGESVSLSDDGLTVAIGAPFNGGSDAGHVRVYAFSSGSWTQLGIDINGEAAGDRSGGSVSLSDDGLTVAIGATFNDGTALTAGHVRVYAFSSGSWTQLGIDIDGEAADDKYGTSVSLSTVGGLTVAIGARFNDGTASDAGHVRVYDLSALLSSNSFVLSQFNIYPNPVKEHFTIQLSQSLELQKINIYNSLGQFISSTTKRIVDTTVLSSGLYYVEVITNQGKATKKIVVE